MKSRLVLPLLALVCGCKTTESAPKLIGGEEAAADQFPATVALGDCTAARVAPRILLTAAHCVVDKDEGRLKYPYRSGDELEVKVGVRTASARELTRKVTVTRVHPTYAARAEELRGTSPIDGRFSDTSDVALIALAEDLDGVALGTLVLEPQAEGTAVVIGGYGCEEEARPPGDGLGEGVIATGAALAGDDDAPAGPRLKFGRARIDRAGTTHYFFRDQRNGLGDVTLKLCPGDSGGPVLLDAAQAGAFTRIVAVNSYGSLGSSAAARLDAVAACLETALATPAEASSAAVPRLCDGAAPPP